MIWKRGKRFTDEQIDSVVKMYVEDGLGVTKIAARFRTHHKNISEILKEKGIEIRGAQPDFVPSPEEIERAKIEIRTKGFVDQDGVYHAPWTREPSHSIEDEEPEADRIVTPRPNTGRK